MDYNFIKSTYPDWMTWASSQLRSDVKLALFRLWFQFKDKDKLMNFVRKIYEPFLEAIGDEALSNEYRKEFESFATSCLDKLRMSVGSLTASQFVLALQPKLTEAQVKVVAQFRTPSAEIRIQNGETIAKALADFKPKDYAYNRATAADTFYDDVHESVKEFLADYEDFVRDKDYIANVNPRNIAEMNTRFEAYKQQKRKLIEDGVRLVVVPAHANCSKRCEHYQGKLYSLDGTDGVFDGREFRPIEEVADNVTYTSQRTGRTYYAGLFSYNCRHTMEPYEKGMNVEKIPHSVIERQREIEMQQRIMERKYRRLREKHEIWLGLYEQTKNDYARKMASDTWKMAIQERKSYIKFCQDNDVPIYLKRLVKLPEERLYERTKTKREARQEDKVITSAS